MNKEEILIQKAKKVLNDFKREYFEDTFKIYTPEKVKEIDIHHFDYDVHEVVVDVPDEQFGGQSPYFIFFKEETMEPFMFNDLGAPGRVPKLEIIKKNGKYEIGDEWKNQ